MKRHGNLWHKIIEKENLYLAFYKAQKGKSEQKGVIEFKKDIQGNIDKIHTILVNKTFATAKYKLKVIHEPKERKIYILPFSPDRIVQHALLRIIIPIWDNLMMYNSYACREGKGMHEASKKTKRCVETYKYCLKCDISKFYPSIDHNILLAIVKKKIKCRDTLWLIEDIIRSFPGGKNIPIGNYTSQWFGNLYLNELDTYLKQECRIKKLIRYCDDFIMFGDDKDKLHTLKDKINTFILRNLDLSFSKWTVLRVTQGVDFLGYRHFPDKILLRKSTAKRVQKRLKILPDKLDKKKINIDQYRSTIASTEGWLKWANTYNFRLSLGIKDLKKVLYAT